MSFKANKSQEEAINTLKGPVMIVSCPGSGKTTTLIRRIHHMIESGISPSNILMVTFSKAAAIEMREKYEKFFGENPGISFQTIHSLCFNLLIKEGKFTKSNVLQENEKLDYLVSLIRLYPQAEGAVFEIAKWAATEISTMKNNYENASEYVPKQMDADMFKDIYIQYEHWKTSINKIDFDDMLIQCKRMLGDEKILKKWQEHFLYIQCDEYQDTNTIQRDILYLLSGKEQNLCVVGDDDQSIYRFRGARPEIMLHFMDDFPNGKKIMMGTNYRSAGEIVEKAGKIILKNKVRYGKTFVSQRGEDGVKGYTEYLRLDNRQAEMEYLPRKIEEYHKEGIDYKDMAILFRTNGQAVSPISALSTAKIPFYSMEPVKCIYDGWIFNELKTYIELACGIYADEVDMRKKIMTVLNKPNRYLNPNSFSNVDFTQTSFRTAISPLMKEAHWKYAAALEQVDTWMRVLGPGRLSLSDSPETVFRRFTGPNTIHYERQMNDMAKFRNTDASDYMEEYEEIKTDACRFKTIADWFKHANWMSQFIKEESLKKNPEGVVLATMHKSKGLEWKVVFIIDCNDGVIPHKNSSENEQDVEEERRLFYVAMTRAKDSLIVINTNKNESPFIKEAKLLTAEERIKSEEIPKYLPGKKVVHKSFGEGKLVSYGPNNIAIDFKKGRKLFPFPDSFKNGTLKYC